MLKPLEFKEFIIKEQIQLNNRKKVIEKELNLKNVKYTSQYNDEKGYYIYLYYYMEEIIMLEKDKLNYILSLLNEKKEINDENDKLYKSKNPRRIINFLDIYPENFNYFKFDTIYDKEHMERIDKYQLPLYKVMKENKYALLKILKTHSLNYDHDDINHFLLHDRIPFINYEDLKKNLTKFYNIKKEEYHKIFKKNHEEACLYLMARNEVIITEEPMGFNVYSKEPYRGENEENLMRSLYITKIDNQVKNNRNFFLDNMSNKEIINLVIDKNKIAKTSEKNIYHHGYYDNGIYKCEKELDKEKIKIDDKLIKIEIVLDYENFYNILIKIGKENIDLDYFYIPEDKEFILSSILEKLWEKGYFLSQFGKAIYLNEDKILESELRIPKWLISNNKKDFENLIKKINNLN